MTWPTKKLGEVLDYEQPGKYIVGSKNYGSEFKTPVLTAGKTFILGNTDEKENIFPVDELPVIIFDDFTTAIKFVDFPFKVKSSAMKILHAKKGKSDAKFLFYFMQTLELNHNTHKRYWISEYSKIEIPLPPLSEQKKVVARVEKLLAKVKEVKRFRAEALEDASKLLEIELSQVLFRNSKWPMKKVFDICERIQNYNNSTLPPGPFKYIDISSVHRGKGIVEHKIYSINNAPSRARRPIKTDDILFALTRPYLRNIAYANKDYNDAVASTGFSILRVKKNILDSKFLYYIINSDWFMKKIIPFQRGATYPAIGESVIWRQEIPFPPLSEQKKIVARLDKLSEKVKNLEKYQKKTAEDLTAFDQSILHTAFSGEKFK